MTKLLQFFSLAGLIFVGYGLVVSPNDPIFWLASAAPGYQFVRLGAGVILLIQLFTHPPRHMTFRLFTGTLAIVLGGWAINETYNNHMQLLDLLVFLSAAITMLETALERRSEKLFTHVATKES